MTSRHSCRRSHRSPLGLAIGTPSAVLHCGCSPWSSSPDAPRPRSPSASVTRARSSRGPIASSSMISRATRPTSRPNRRLPPNWLVPSRRPRSSARSAASWALRSPSSWWRICWAWGCSPCGLPANRRRRSTTSCCGAISSPSTRAAPAKRVLVGFGSGAAEIRAAVEGYQMTAQGLRLLGSGEVRSGGGKTPGHGAPSWPFSPPPANPIGLVVGGMAKLYGEGTGSDRIEGAAERTADEISAQLQEGRRGAGLDLVRYIGWMLATIEFGSPSGVRLAGRRLIEVASKAAVPNRFGSLPVHSARAGVFQTRTAFGRPPTR